MGEGGRCGAGGRTATVDRNSGGLELGGGEWSHGEVKQRVGRGAVGCYGARSSFYRARGWEGRRCGEGNGRRRRCAIKAFKTLVLGGERRGEWGVKRGPKYGAISGRGWVIEAAGACRGGGGGGARSGFRRKKTTRLTDSVGPPVSEGEATGQAGPERKGRGGLRLGWKGKEEAGPKSLLGLKSKRVKEN
jgi:hypothetical protein